MSLLIILPSIHLHWPERHHLSAMNLRHLKTLLKIFRFKYVGRQRQQFLDTFYFWNALLHAQQLKFLFLSKSKLISLPSIVLYCSERLHLSKHHVGRQYIWVHLKTLFKDFQLKINVSIVQKHLIFNRSPRWAPEKTQFFAIFFLNTVLHS